MYVTLVDLSITKDATFRHDNLGAKIPGWKWLHHITSFHAALSKRPLHNLFQKCQEDLYNLRLIFPLHML